MPERFAAACDCLHDLVFPVLRGVSACQTLSAYVQLREARWVIPDLLGKGNRTRTVPMPAGVKARIDLWTKAAEITSGRIFQPVTKAGVAPSST